MYRCTIEMTHSLLGLRKSKLVVELGQDCPEGGSSNRCLSLGRSTHIGSLKLSAHWQTSVIGPKNLSRGTGCLVLRLLPCVVIG